MSSVRTSGSFPASTCIDGLRVVFYLVGPPASTCIDDELCCVLSGWCLHLLLIILLSLVFPGDEAGVLLLEAQLPLVVIQRDAANHAVAVEGKPVVPSCIQLINVVFTSLVLIHPVFQRNVWSVCPCWLWTLWSWVRVVRWRPKSLRSSK